MLVFVSIVALALGLRFYHLDHEPLHVDEIKQVQEVQAPLGEIVELSYRHTQPPLDYLIGKAVVSSGSIHRLHSTSASRSLGRSAVGLLVLVLLRLGMPMAAGISGVLAAIHPFLIHWRSTHVRALSVFMVVAMQWCRVSTLETRLANPMDRHRFYVGGFSRPLSHAIMPMLALAILGGWGRSVRKDQSTGWGLPSGRILWPG